ncbi:MAG: c-type cytochrome domain-containing protein [Verrucomicrobiota bacterium]
MKTYINFGFIVLFAAQTSGAESGKISFNRDIRPILSDTCFHCHGFDPKSRKAGLRLDERAAALIETKNGVLPIVPGKPEESAIIQRVLTTDADEIMPPVKAHKELTLAQKELLKRWVAEGAVYEPHWAYASLEKPEIPHNGRSDPVDAFILKSCSRRI